MFSSALTLSDLNDYIAPSQACVKPPVKELSLDDCLACSGCITSAEAVLVQLQSHTELINVLRDKKDRLVVVSISQQSLASIALKCSLSIQVVHSRLQAFLATLGVDYTLDIALARDISLLESAREFVGRYTLNKSQSTEPAQLPMLASSCPGWICYSEKTHPDILGLIDSTKSPQQVMGTLVKHYLASKLQLEPQQVYHVAVMPCYDKKLEASRKDFYNDLYRSRDVDCVITTGELERMLAEHSVDIQSLPDAPITNILDECLGLECESRLYRTEGSSSGGCLSFILRYAARELFNISLTPQDIAQGTNGVTITRGRNSDFCAVAFTPPGNPAPALIFAYAYGFKNIQNIVRKVKPKAGLRPSASKEKYDFVEIMACPSGCINGGGQLKEEEGRSPQRIEALNQVYHDASLPLQLTETNPLLERVYAQFANSKEKVLAYLHTAYHELERPKDSLHVQW